MCRSTIHGSLNHQSHFVQPSPVGAGQLQPIQSPDFPKSSVPGIDWGGVQNSILDGGGLGSTADWLQPRVSKHLFKPLRKHFEGLVGARGLIPRLRKHVANKSSQDLVTDGEGERAQLRAAIVEFLAEQGFPAMTRLLHTNHFFLVFSTHVAR